MTTARRPRTLRPVRPSAAIDAEYRRRLLRLIDAMAADVESGIARAYARHEPRTLAGDEASPRSPAPAIDGARGSKELASVSPSLAFDETPVSALLRQFRRMGRRWAQRWERGAENLARWFSTETSKRSTTQLRRILREAGISIEFTMSAAMRDATGAIVAENVALIRSIPQQYLGQVEGIVTRGVAAGRDAATIATELRARHGVTRRRAALIARDQNNKATAAFNRIRQLEAGITQAVWVHSGGGREPRPTHVRAGQERTVFAVAEGWYDPHERQHVLPGQLINCRCFSRPVLPALARLEARS